MIAGFRASLGLAALSGALMALAFPGFEQGWLAWVAAVPLLLVISGRRARGAFGYGFLAGAVFFGILLSWLLSLEVWVGWTLAILAWAALGFVQALTFGIFGAVAAVVMRSPAPWVRLVLVPAAWVTLELLRSVGPWGFSWGVLGSSQASAPLLLGPARLVGAFGLSYLIIFFGQTVIEGTKAGVHRRSLWPAVTALVTVMAFVAAGYIFRPTEFGRPSKVVLVQGNVSQEDKWRAGNLTEITDSYIRTTRRAGRNDPDLIIWPETAVPARLNRNPALVRRLELLAKETGAYLLTGASYADDQDQDYNSTFLFGRSGKLVDRYDKINLVLFGEYVPPWPLVRNMKTVAGLGESLVSGKRLTKFETDRGALATGVCFESSSPFLTRNMIGNGARLLVVVTNDAWFGRTAAPAQHLDLLKVRAVENGVYAVQAANTGLSALISPTGETLARSGLFTEETVSGEIRFASSVSLYNRGGFLVPYAFPVILAAHILGTIARRRSPS